MAGRTLFLMAGYSGVGKSALLRYALINKIPIFGEEFDHLFQTIKIPPIREEWGMTTQEIVDHGTWFDLIHLPGLSQLQDLPASVMLHVDLVTALGLDTKSGRTTMNSSAAMLPRFRRVLSVPFMNNFDTVVVNTLYASWQTTANQWNERQRQRGCREEPREFLFDFSKPAIELYNTAYRAWIKAVAELKPYHSLFTETRNNTLSVMKLPA